MKLQAYLVLALLGFAHNGYAQYSFDSVVISFKNIPVSGEDGTSDGAYPGTGYKNTYTNRPTNRTVILRNPTLQVVNDTIRLVSGFGKIDLQYDSTTNIATFLNYDYVDNSSYYPYIYRSYLKNIRLFKNAVTSSWISGSSVADHLTVFSHSSAFPATHGSRSYSYWNLGDKFTDASEISLTLYGNIPLEVQTKKSSSQPLNVYPNPAEQYIRIDLPAVAREYEIYDNIGRKMLSGVLASGINYIDISTLGEAAYYLRIKDYAAVPLLIVR